MRSFGYNIRCGFYLDKMMKADHRASRRNCIDAIMHHYLSLGADNIPVPGDTELYDIPIARRYVFELDAMEEAVWTAYMKRINCRTSGMTAAVLIDMYLTERFANDGYE